jgi:GNAT superfamily N-acetyltransferase
MTLEIVSATTPGQLDAVRDLLRAYVAWLRARDGADREAGVFSANTIEEELAGLPGKYAPPRGRLLLAELEERPVGCVALREVDAQTCEMKRMFVPTDLHGQGVGRALADAILHEARAIGYTSMRLDTGREARPALGLYRSLGFVEIAPYYEMPPDVGARLVFMELQL